MVNQISPTVQLIIDEELIDLKYVIKIFNTNRNRSLNLLHQSKKLVDPKGDQEKILELLMDISRAAVVFLHSALETTIREIARLKFKHDGDLFGIPIDDLSELKNRKEKFSLVDLVKHRGRSVDEVIEGSIDRYLSHFSFNNTNDIAEILKRINLNQNTLVRYYADIDEMMERRHRIVHEGDIKRGEKTFELVPIDPQSLSKWITAITEFGNELFVLTFQTVCLDKIIKKGEEKGINIDREMISKIVEIKTDQVL